MLDSQSAAFAERVWRHGPANEQQIDIFFRAHGLPGQLAEQVRATMAENRAMT